MTTDRNTLPARQRILLTAHDLFYQEGIRATGIDRIIKESGVTKVTFYRHFPSKNDLITAFLAYRHQQWLTWFSTALDRHVAQSGGLLPALAPCLAEWFDDPRFRGCAFINTAVEIADLLPESLHLAGRHKQQMTDELARHLPADPQREQHAAILAMLIDGAIIRVQIERQPQPALQVLNAALALLAQGGFDQ
ncbi:TetR/AcrR family transcriptional regulator [Serratia marcescens]|uniref:TetR/AcrR family transcriptional regulator n=1 Tax=Serratia TaxID=613 RepID=UPI000B603706|nr:MULTISPECIES: TetR/AcrR family transcriptional regulator [Serratia]ASL93680.1 TetR family transcriptional regulator [Serratia marcescens]MBH2660152.1 TetR/AcrR family transcriptional regulator [Serratia ureilytica]MBH2700012.1 TetR/AcrR family transcriptional regulator [Serratia ureilytica]MBH2736178.1 TetR/AcrR family transcriptional regulator [Serratia ureilytica]MBH3074286.1 TetR/AcrR family transcriptional regulator [Serratia ureilytica]